MLITSQRLQLIQNKNAESHEGCVNVLPWRTCDAHFCNTNFTPQRLNGALSEASANSKLLCHDVTWHARRICPKERRTPEKHEAMGWHRRTGTKLQSSCNKSIEAMGFNVLQTTDHPIVGCMGAADLLADCV